MGLKLYSFTGFMAIEIESGFSIKKSVLPILVLLVSVAVLIFLVSSYIFLDNASNDITKQIEEKNQKLAETPEEAALKEELAGYEFKINNFKLLSESRKKPGNIFGFLEKVCHPDVLFDSFSFSTDGNAVVIAASAKDFIVLAQQLMILKEYKDTLSKITVSGIGAGEDEEIQFSLNLTFAPQIFKNNNE